MFFSNLIHPLSRTSSKTTIKKLNILQISQNKPLNYQIQTIVKINSSSVAALIKRLFLFKAKSLAVALTDRQGALSVVNS